MSRRLGHIDQMKAIAVLCMVEVHTAAILPPKGISVDHPAAFLAAAFGGMAAPMFVTLSGWGIYRSGLNKIKSEKIKWPKWILSRFILLFACQILVNISLNIDRGGRFYWHTPGVLTLLAVSSVLIPLILMISFKLRNLIMITMIFFPLFIGEYSGLDWSWNYRVNSQGIYEWLERLLLNGTYPLIPWLGYIFLGTLIHDLDKYSKTKDDIIKIGLFITAVTILISIIDKKSWALTSGDAILTFFPASTSFLIVSGTMVILLMRILEGDEASGEKSRYPKLSYLEPVGKITLTIYVLHFFVLGVTAIIMDEKPRFDIFTAFSITIAHTLIWIPLANWHQNNIPNISFEYFLKKIN